MLENGVVVRDVAALGPDHINDVNLQIHNKSRLSKDHHHYFMQMVVQVELSTLSIAA